MLEKDRDDRPADAGELEAELADIADALPDDWAQRRAREWWAAHHPLEPVAPAPPSTHG